MRILIATSCRGIVGGLETYLQILIPALLGRGHEVALVYDFANAPSAATVDPPDAELPRWNSGDLLKDPGAWRELAEWKPDVVYSHGLESIAVEKALQQDYPTVFYAHTYRGTCATGRKCHAFPALQTCHRTLGPACLALHYPRRCGGLNPLVAWENYSTQMSFKALFPDYRAVLVASRHMRQELERHGVHRHQLHLTPLPVAEADHPSMPREKAPHGRLLFIGRLVDVKGARFLIEAMPKAARQLAQLLTVTIAGDGQERRELQDLAHRLGVNAEFPGWVAPRKRQDLVREADLLVVPSLWPEPFGLVGLEAGCLGVPAVGYAVGGIPDWLIPGQSGELAPDDPPTVDGLAQAIVRALRDPQYYMNLCRGAWEQARQFSLERHIAQLESILASAHAPGGVSPALSHSV
jgi:glycosyltransferase involved in cell wall biosynthesis